MGLQGPFGIVGVAIGFAILYWLIRQLDKDGTLKAIFTLPKTGRLSDWIGWVIVGGFLLLVFYQMVNSILTGENGCDAGQYVDRWGNCQ
jgi:hypothetical protein